MHRELLGCSQGAQQAPRHFLHNKQYAKQEMTELDQYPRHSPLCQTVTRDGKTVRIEIYEDGEGGWLLEVVDDYGNSSVWDDPFATDQGALDEVLKTISEEGIASLIGSPSEGLPMTGLNQPLSEAELVELDEEGTRVEDHRLGALAEGGREATHVRLLGRERLAPEVPGERREKHRDAA